MTTTGGNAVFLDTNILVFSAANGSPFQQPARQAIQSLWTQNRPLWISRQTIREYAVVMTRPQTFMQPVKMSTVLAHISLFHRYFKIADDNQLVTRYLIKLLRTYP